MAQQNANPVPTPNPSPKLKKKKTPWGKIVTAAAVGTALVVIGLYAGSRGNKAPTYNQINNVSARQVEVYGGNDYSKKDQSEMTTEVTKTVQQVIGNNYELGHSHGHNHHGKANLPGDASGH